MMMAARLVAQTPASPLLRQPVDVRRVHDPVTVGSESRTQVLGHQQHDVPALIRSGGDAGRNHDRPQRNGEGQPEPPHHDPLLGRVARIGAARRRSYRIRNGDVSRAG
jgi:hypothetical protein